jgi:hypothetical protein
LLQKLVDELNGPTVNIQLADGYRPASGRKDGFRR